MIRIHFDKKRFEVQCPFHENDLVQALPNRRFNKGSKTWIVPAVRVNIEAIKSWPDKYTSPEAEKFLAAYSAKQWVKKEPFPLGYKYLTKPFPYQVTGANKIWPYRNSALFMDPGTGKSKIAIDIATARFQLGQIKQVVVLGLVSIKTNWEEEIRKHCPEPCDISLANTSKKGKREQGEFCSKRGVFKWLVLGVESLSSGAAFEMVKSFLTLNTLIIVDESSRIKNHKAIRTARATELGTDKHVKYKMILTGTPVTQGVIDLFSQFEFLDPDIIGIGSFYAFRNTYCVMGGFENRQIFGYKNIPQLTKVLDPHIYQVRKRDVLSELPDFTRQVRKIQMSPEQVKLYKDLKTNLKVKVDNNELTVMNVMNLMQRFSEITGGHISYETENPDPLTKDKKPVIYERKRLKKSPKLDEMMDLVGSMPEDEPVIIWSPKIAEIDWIQERLRAEYGHESVGLLTGKANEAERLRVRTEFQAGTLRFIVGNPSVGGIGLNLTAARYVIYYSRDFSLEISIQSEARIDRIGQTRAMTYYDLVCAKTIDEHVLKVLLNKDDFAETIRSAFQNNDMITDFL
jgi:SNF2 family DNA or RNA helicase